MLLDGKRLVITGVLTDSSIAFAAARHAQEEGAEIVLTSFGRAARLTERAARRLPETPDVLELDVTEPENLAALTDDLGERWGSVDGVLHAVAFAPETCLGGGFLEAPWEDVSTALRISAHSLAGLAGSVRPLMQGGGAIVGLDFDNSSVAWPVYDWMGVAKAAFESTARYLARELGPENIRVNLVAAGPLRTMAAKSIPGFERFEEVWAERAPLGWDVRDPEPVARAVTALFSDLFPATTGEVVHVDGGFHAVGA
ncbi:MAG: enoyl-ACP reductase FabI [Acidimicrobiia bacterium]